MTLDPTNWLGAKLAGGRYEISARLGEGGMGQVYRAHDHNLFADVVIKAPRPGLLDSTNTAERFAREVRALVKLQHPHIVGVLDVGEHAGLPFLVLQYLPGGSLENRRTKTADGNYVPMPLVQIFPWLPKTAAALDFIHQKGYVHRDVKPGNILFDAAGHVYLSDFGIAKGIAGTSDGMFRPSITADGQVLGTLLYMAPELLLGDTYTCSVDQYALGVMVFHLLAGGYPFEGSTPASLYQRIATQPPAVPANLPPRLAAVLQRAFARYARQRYASCTEFVKEFLAVANDAATGGNLVVLCPHCRRRLTVEKGAFQAYRCPHCQTAFRLPRQQD